MSHARLFSRLSLARHARRPSLVLGHRLWPPWQPLFRSLPLNRMRLRWLISCRRVARCWSSSTRRAFSSTRRACSSTMRTARPRRPRSITCSRSRVCRRMRRLARDTGSFATAVSAHARVRRESDTMRDARLRSATPLFDREAHCEVDLFSRCSKGVPTGGASYEYSACIACALVRRPSQRAIGT